MRMRPDCDQSNITIRQISTSSYQFIQIKLISIGINITTKLQLYTLMQNNVGATGILLANRRGAISSTPRIKEIITVRVDFQSICHARLTAEEDDDEGEATREEAIPSIPSELRRRPVEGGWPRRPSKQWRRTEKNLGMAVWPMDQRENQNITRRKGKKQFQFTKLYDATLSHHDAISILKHGNNHQS